MRAAHGSIDDKFLHLIHDLRRTARLLMRSERAITLQPTALVNEVYLRLMQRPEYADLTREHFLAISAHVMKHIIIDYARRRRPTDHLDTEHLPPEQRQALWDVECLIQITQVLELLKRVDPLAASVAELKLFTGVSAEETAAILGVPPAKARRGWTFANAWLQAHSPKLSSHA